MAKIRTIGAAVVFTSDVKLEDIKFLAKYDPEALKLYKGEGKEKELEFVAAIGGEAGKVNAYGVEFAKTTNDPDGKAQVTLMKTFGGKSGDELKGEIADAYGVAIKKLGELEATIPAALEKVKADRAAVIAQIEG